MASAVLLAIFRLHNTAMAPLHRCAAPRSYATYLLLGRTPRAARLAGRCSFLLMPRERDGQCGVAGDVRTSQRVDGALASLRPYATRFARDMPGWSGSRQEGELAEFDRDPIKFGVRWGKERLSSVY